MEPKRRKILTSTKEEMHEHMGLYLRFCQEGESVAVINEIRAERNILKETKDNVKQFFEDKVDYFWNVAVFFQKLAADVLANDISKRNSRCFEAVDELLKMLTVCCVGSSVSEKSTSTLLFKDSGKTSNLPQLMTRLLEAGERVPNKTKILLLDYISGLCTRKNGMLVISSKSPLIDRVAYYLTHENAAIRDAAITTVLFVSKHSRFLKTFLCSNGGYYLGANLALQDLDELKNVETKSFRLFEALTEFDIRSFGQQLARSPGLKVVVEMMFSEDSTKVIHNWHKLIIKMLMTTYELRDAFGLQALQRAVHVFRSTKNAVVLKYLCVSAQDAWARKYLRTSGCLTLIIEEFEAEFDSQCFLVIKNLRHFKHDSEGLLSICRCESFLDKLLLLLAQCCKKPDNEKCELPQIKQVLRPDSPNFLAHLSKLEQQKQSAYLDSTNFHKDYAEVDSCSRASSNSPKIRSAWSTSPSPTYPGSNPSASPSPSARSISEDSGGESDHWVKTTDEPDYLSDEDTDEDKKESLTADRKKKMGPYLLEMVDLLTYHPENHVLLMKKPVVEILILLIAKLPSSMAERACRAIKRLVRSDECLPQLLNKKLHIEIIKQLIRRPCLLTRYAPRCTRCEDKRLFGRELIQELSLRANSTAGWSFLENMLKSSVEETRFFALTTGLTLIRDVNYRKKLYQSFDALTFLYAEVSDVLTNVEVAVSGLSMETSVEEMEAARTEELIKNAEKLEAVLFSSASLVSHKMMHEILESQSEFREAFKAMISRPCQLREPPEDRKIVFKNGDGKVLESVDVELLCKNSEYYRGMFENPFLESTCGKKEFIMENESIDVKDEHFIKFLHLLSGCKDSRCVAIESTLTCVSLVYLSDKYLALEISEQLLSKNGMAQHFLTGATIHQFAPTLVTALATGKFSDLFFLVLLRYSTREEIYKTLCAMLNLRSCKAFCDLLKEFLQRCVDHLPHHLSFRVWI